MAGVAANQIGYEAVAVPSRCSVDSDARSSNASIAAGPVPNPPFKFPMQAPVADPPTAIAARTAHNTEGRIGSRPRPPQISIQSLPAFAFPLQNIISAPTAHESLAQSPTRSLPIPPRTGGHRRRGSELIGDGMPDGLGLMSTSPTKSEGTLPSPPVSGQGPPWARRGHAHRRSAAISSNDLSAILRPAHESRSGSAPSTPSDPYAHRHFIPNLDRSISQPTLSSSLSTHIDSDLNKLAITPSHGQTRPRVGFSDTLEFIPRPLSTISSETSSSLSTIRPSHSVTGSLSSVLSGSTSSPSSASRTQLLVDPPLEDHELIGKRPNSAGALLNMSPTSSRLGGNVVTPRRPSSMAAFPLLIQNTFPSTIAKAENRLGAEAVSDHASSLFPFSSSETSNSPNYMSLPLAVTKRLSAEKGQRSTPQLSRPRSSPEVGVAKRQRKVRSWAGSILSRRSRQRGSEILNIRNISPLAPLRDFAPVENFALEDVNFDEDTTCTIHSPQYETLKSVETVFPNPRLPPPQSFRETEPFSPLLDLDAVLAPSDGSDVDDDQSPAGGFSSAKRRMHSSGATGAFSGPGMHYHRRAESAPVMAPVDYHLFGVNRTGNNSAMADVFEEEEEDENQAQDPMRKRRSAGIQNGPEFHGLGVDIADCADTEHPSILHGMTHRNIGNGQRKLCPNHNRTRDREIPPSSQPSDVVSSDSMLLEIVDAVDEPRFSTLTKSSDDSTITPTISHVQLGSPSTSDDLQPQSPKQVFDTSEPVSMLPSPDLAHRSFEGARLHTANSSVTDRTTWSSSRPGEPRQWLSTEDVPSLTSSASTVISGLQPSFSSSAGNRYSGERSNSYSAAVPARVRPSTAGKRSSLASLSRLVGSSYGEKSKLSTELRTQQDEAEKSEKKRGNRVSRLMRFWKLKEKLVQ